MGFNLNTYLVATITIIIDYKKDLIFINPFPSHNKYYLIWDLITNSIATTIADIAIVNTLHFINQILFTIPLLVINFIVVAIMVIIVRIIIRLLLSSTIINFEKAYILPIFIIIKLEVFIKLAFNYKTRLKDFKPLTNDPSFITY